MLLEIIQWFTTIAAVTGAMVLAAGRPVVGYAIMIPGCFAGVYYCIETLQSGFFARELAFLAINSFGFYNWYRINKNNSLDEAKS